MYINKCRIILILIKIIYLNWLAYQTFIFCSAKTELFAANQNDRKICIWSWKPNRGPWRTTEDGCGCASYGKLHQGVLPGPVWTPPDYLLRTGKAPCQIIKNYCRRTNSFKKKTLKRPKNLSFIFKNGFVVFYFNKLLIFFNNNLLCFRRHQFQHLADKAAKLDSKDCFYKLFLKKEF